MQLQLLNGPFVSPSLSWKKKGYKFLFLLPTSLRSFSTSGPWSKEVKYPLFKPCYLLPLHHLPSVAITLVITMATLALH